MYVLFHQVIDYIYAIFMEAHRDIFIISQRYFILYYYFILLQFTLGVKYYLYP